MHWILLNFIEAASNDVCEKTIFSAQLQAYDDEQNTVISHQSDDVKEKIFTMILHYYSTTQEFLILYFKIRDITFNHGKAGCSDLYKYQNDIIDIIKKFFEVSLKNKQSTNQPFLYDNQRLTDNSLLQLMHTVFTIEIQEKSHTKNEFLSEKKIVIDTILTMIGNLIFSPYLKSEEHALDIVKHMCEINKNESKYNADYNSILKNNLFRSFDVFTKNLNILNNLFEITENGNSKSALSLIFNLEFLQESVVLDQSEVKSIQNIIEKNDINEIIIFININLNDYKIDLMHHFDQIPKTNPKKLYSKQDKDRKDISNINLSQILKTYHFGDLMNLLRLFEAYFLDNVQLCFKNIIKAKDEICKCIELQKGTKKRIQITLIFLKDELNIESLICKNFENTHLIYNLKKHMVRIIEVYHRIYIKLDNEIRKIFNQKENELPLFDLILH